MYFKKVQSEFEKYLIDTFSLISKGYYTKRGIGLGSSFGILFGVVVLSNLERSLGISLGMIIGMLIGLTIGLLWILKLQRMAGYYNSKYKRINPENSIE